MGNVKQKYLNPLFLLAKAVRKDTLTKVTEHGQSLKRVEQFRGWNCQVYSFDKQNYIEKYYQAIRLEKFLNDFYVQSYILDKPLFLFKGNELLIKSNYFSTSSTMDCVYLANTKKMTNYLSKFINMPVDLKLRPVKYPYLYPEILSKFIAFSYHSSIARKTVSLIKEKMLHGIKYSNPVYNQLKPNSTKLSQIFKHVSGTQPIGLTVRMKGRFGATGGAARAETIRLRQGALQDKVHYHKFTLLKGYLNSNIETSSATFNNANSAYTVRVQLATNF